MKEFLSQRGIPYTEKYVDQDRAAAMEMVRRSGQSGVPVTVIGDQVVVGFDKPRLERILASMSVRAKGQAGRKSLGAKVADASRYALAGGVSVQGAYVGGVNPGSPAEASGLRTGDIITAVDGKAVRSADELAKAISHLSDATARLTVVHGVDTREVNVRL